MKRNCVFLIIAVIISIAPLLMQKSCPKITKGIIYYDTIVLRDTVRDTVLLPRRAIMLRVDTVWLRSARDTVFVEVEVPVERKIYETEDYRAVVEGFRPRLAEMEVYRNTIYVNSIERITVPDRRRWGIGIQAGYGYMPSAGPAPYVGVGIQYNLITW